VLWLSPIYLSPQINTGYDISDYEAVDPRYGTIQDMQELIEKCHENDMKMILDLVVNHTSDQHAWFKESRRDKGSEKRDWYIWRPARYDEHGERLPPTNWRSYRGGSAWTWDEQTEEYYLHIYDGSQPDLNWENADCHAAIYDSAMRFWLDRGIDGFRIDTVNKFSKVLLFVDVPILDQGCSIPAAEVMWCNGPRMHEFIREMHREVFSKYRTYDGLPIVAVGELSMCSDPSAVLSYISAANKELDIVLQPDITRLGKGAINHYVFQPWTLPDLKRIVATWQTSIDGTDAWTTVCSENHDNGRSVSRLANDAPEWCNKSAKMLAVWMIGLTGSLFLYQGQEIGMVNAPRTWDIGVEYKDPASQSDWAAAVAGPEHKKEAIKRGMQLMARDHSRLPFQWDGSKKWMRVHDDYPEVNVAKQEEDEQCVLSFYRKVLRLRKEHKDVLVYGTFELLDEGNLDTFVYVKRYEEKMAFVALNFSTEPREMPSTEGMSLLVSTYSETRAMVLQPLEGNIYVNY
jgi:oligo-1,6-glucosidase